MNRHAPAEGDVDAVAVEAALALADGVTEPLLQHKGPEQQAADQRVHAPAVAIDPLARPEDDKEQARGGQDRMPGRTRARSSTACCRGTRCGHRAFSSTYFQSGSAASGSRHATADDPLHQQHQHHDKQSRANEAGDHDMHGVELCMSLA